ncbi:hypothetical protein GW17_00026131 [Ensete ventricosum]|nr:hypothetical protein GW17_00026131 [Ensete ventricosum]
MGGTYRSARLPVTFVHKGFDETRRLGLQNETEKVCCNSLDVPGGPAHKYLEPGDVLVRVNGDVSRSILLLIILSTNFCCH